jgi:glycosyltransferase involved in cell wall biosynthesis
MQGGVGGFTRELAAAMAAQGHEVHIFTDERAKHSSEPSIQVTGMVRNWNWGSLVQARRWAQANRLDMINIQYQAAAFRMAPFVHLLPSRLNGFPIVTTFHDLLVPYLFPKAGPLRYQAVLTLARSSDGVIVTNGEDRNRLSTERGIARLKHVPIGSNIPLNPPPDYVRKDWRAQIGVPPEGILAGYFGFLNASKGIETLLQGLAEACKAGLDLYLVMIGGRVGSSDATNIRYAEQIDDLIEDLNIESRLIWTDFVDDAAVSAYLLACDFLVLPFKDGVSFRRGSFMAGLAHGCAIITTTPAADLPELRDGLNVRLIPPESPAALHSAVESLSENVALREQLQTNAQALSRLFNWENIAAETVSFYQEIIESAVART